jgi:hypothetical protein
LDFAAAFVVVAFLASVFLSCFASALGSGVSPGSFAPGSHSGADALSWFSETLFTLPQRGQVAL